MPWSCSVRKIVSFRKLVSPSLSPHEGFPQGPLRWSEGERSLGRLCRLGPAQQPYSQQRGGCLRLGGGGQ